MTVLEVFRLMASEFAAVDNAIVEQWAELTAPLVSRKQFGRLYEQGVALLTAHRMKVAGVSGGQTEEGGSGFQMSIADTLRVSSYSEGSTSISFNNAASTATADSELTLTEYGVQFKNLRSMVIIPIRCSGEVR